jgi:VCBS repeat-containing protein
VTDSLAPTRSASATVTITVTDVNEFDPVIANQAFSVAENTPNLASVGTVLASDADTSQTLTYVITAGNTGGAFAINAATGEITVANTGALDHEVNPTIVLTVQVTDSLAPTRSASATVTITVTDVNEFDPVIANQAFSVAENTPNLASVGTVLASDADTSQTLTYVITGGNTGGAFAINAATGEITVANSLALDHEVNPTIALTVQVTDSLAPTRSASATVTITVTDVNEAPVLPAGQSFNVNEQSLAGTVVGTAVASDQDVASTLTWSIVGGNVGGAFTIDPATGLIRVANPAAIDFETYPLFTLTLRVEDSGGLADTASVQVALNDVVEPVVTPPPPGPGPAPDPGPDTDGSEPDDPTDEGEERDEDELATVLDVAAPPQRAVASVAAGPLLPASDSAERLARVHGERDRRAAAALGANVAPASDESEGDTVTVDPNLWKALDLMNLDMSGSADDDSNALIYGSVQGASAVMVAGFLTWFLRGGALLTSLLSTLPLWARIDPLPVLAMSDEERERKRRAAKRSGLPEEAGEDPEDDEASPEPEGEAERRAAEILEGAEQAHEGSETGPG